MSMLTILPMLTSTFSNKFIRDRCFEKKNIQDVKNEVIFCFLKLINVFVNKTLFIPAFFIAGLKKYIDLLLFLFVYKIFARF